MKGIDMLCVSQASTAICLSMDEASSSSSSSSSAIQLGGRAIDRHNPIIRDGRRSVPCSSQPPINPKPYHQLPKTKKVSKPSTSNITTTTTTSTKQNEQKRKTSTKSQAKLADYIKTGSSSMPKDHVIARKSWAKKAADLVTPPGSSRYLLGDTAFIDGLSDYHDPVLELLPFGNNKNQHVSNSTATKEDSSSLHAKQSSSSNQVVVLRVSLHCKGCEGKVRKHLSRMEGVTSFNIDFAAKKVTVVGDVTPVSVLASISKVKNAQFWTSGVVSSVSPANPNLTTLDTIKQ